MIVDNGDGPRRTVQWDCGCRAHEEHRDRFAVFACRRHGTAIDAERRR
jgi:hypothetical protein